MQPIAYRERELFDERPEPLPRCVTVEQPGIPHLAGFGVVSQAAHDRLTAELDGAVNQNHLPRTRLEIQSPRLRNLARGV